ncbi:hypothetical protein [Methanobrevibacter smithii]|uniref:hypothetical protein n=1 Tax=Methanobrevibacter smithii TaxID=2173 RepID=UPI000375F177|nr:hypothetical protein [Methanobrevibacter smithii]
MIVWVINAVKNSKSNKSIKFYRLEFLEKITAYSNEAIGGVAITGDMKNSLKS